MYAHSYNYRRVPVERAAERVVKVSTRESPRRDARVPY